ncbi:MAG: ABC transporter permease [Alistipes sp.]|jgi:ABC-2 type transport system permease protein|nr:ABC transporter permease [Alistipes sp.]
MLRFLMEKELKQLRRNAFVPKIVAAMPLAMMLVFPWAANQEVKNVRLAVVDADRSTTSQRLVGKVASSGYFRLVDTPATWPLALEDIEAGRADIVMEIARGFERDMVNGAREGSKIMIAANAVNSMKAGLGSSYLSSIIADFGAGLTGDPGVPSRVAGSAGGAGNVSEAVISIAPQYRFNPRLDYKVFMIPGLMVMLMTMLCGFLPALNVVSEKEAGTIEQINVTPVRRFDFVLGKLLPNWLIGLVVLGFCMAVAALVYGLTPAGGVGTVFLFAGIYIVVVSAMGLVVSNHSSTMQQAMFVMFFFVMIFLLMSGLFTPVRSMPGWAQAIAAVNPLKYFIEVMRMVYLKGSGLRELWPQFGALCGFAAFFATWAVVSYKKQL